MNTLVNVTLTYHQSQPEAEAGLNPIMPANAYGSGGEVIWVRGENSAGCYTVGSFGLILGSIPSFVEVPVFEQCDNDGDGVEDEFQVGMAAEVPEVAYKQSPDDLASEFVEGKVYLL